MQKQTLIPLRKTIQTDILALIKTASTIHLVDKNTTSPSPTTKEHTLCNLHLENTSYEGWVDFNLDDVQLCIESISTKKTNTVFCKDCLSVMLETHTLFFTPTEKEMKNLAKELKELSLKHENIKIKHAKALELIANEFGHKDWNTAIATARKNDKAKEHYYSTPSYAKTDYAYAIVDIFKNLYGYDYRIPYLKPLEEGTVEKMGKVILNLLSKDIILQESIDKVERTVFTRNMEGVKLHIPELLRKGRFTREHMKSFRGSDFIRFISSIFKTMKPTFTFTGLVNSGKTYSLLNELRLMRKYLNTDKTLVICDKEEKELFFQVLPMATVLSFEEDNDLTALYGCQHLIIDGITRSSFSQYEMFQIIRGKETLFLTSQEKNIISLLMGVYGS